MTSPPRRHLAGVFNFEALVCSLFANDLDPLAAGEEKIDPQNILFGFNAAFHARRAADVVPFKPFPADLLSRAEVTLFHERVHYWQIIACPLQQWQFVCFLEKVGAEVARMGGEPRYVCSQSIGGQRSVENLALLEEFLVGIDAHFRTVPVTRDMIKLPNLVRSDPFTAMPYLELPRSEGSRLPGYGAVLGLGPGEEPVMFAFNGKYLLESAAYIAQLLFEHKPLPVVLRPSGEHGDVVYWGAWEFWRRLHGDRYDSLETLAYAFLAVIDVALTPDVTNFNREDTEYGYELASIPYRFGKLAYRLQGLPPFQLDPADPARSVAAFQEQICAQSGWAAPDLVARKMAVLLTRILIISSARSLAPSAENEQLVTWLLTTPLPELITQIERLEPVWALFQTLEESAPAIGQLAIGTMLNACFYRIQHPGMFALPHIYFQDLLTAFPLPILLFQGQYFTDIANAGSLNQGWPYPTAPISVIHDLISLMTIKPLRDGNTTCGFIEEWLKCWYVQAGFGCPFSPLRPTAGSAGTGISPVFIPLKPEQATIRATTGLDDWCHWALRSLLLRTAPTELQTKWQQRILETRGS